MSENTYDTLCAVCGGETRGEDKHSQLEECVKHLVELIEHSRQLAKVKVK